MNDICFMVIHPIVGHVLHNCASAARCCSCLRWFRYSQDEVKHLTRGDTTRTDQVATEDTPEFVLWGFLKSLRNILAIHPVIVKVFKVFSGQLVRTEAGITFLCTHTPHQWDAQQDRLRRHCRVTTTHKGFPKIWITWLSLRWVLKMSCCSCSESELQITMQQDQLSCHWIFYLQMKE